MCVPCLVSSVYFWLSDTLAYDYDDLVTGTIRFFAIIIIIIGKNTLKWPNLHTISICGESEKAINLNTKERRKIVRI